MIAAHRKSREMLAEADTRYIVGIPGGGAMRIFDTLYDYENQIKTVFSRLAGKSPQ
jgi:thiamine pyrophosphate-dependent acetolactate synthase large subunit-like protein